MDKKHKITTIIFDYGGVIGVHGYLQDSLLDNDKEKQDWLNYVKNEFSNCFIGGDIDLFFKKSAKFFNEKFEYHKEKVITEWTKINPEVLNILKDLKSKNYNLGLLTNNANGIISQFIENNNLDNFFEFIVDSSEVKLLKKYKEIYEYTIKYANLIPKNCVFIDDNDEVLNLSSEFGFNTILYKNPNQLREELEKFGVLLK